MSPGVLLGGRLTRDRDGAHGAWETLVLPATLIYGLVYLLTVLVPDGRVPIDTTVFYEWAMLPVALVAAIGAVRTAARQRRGSVTRRAWLMVSAAFFGWLLASALWMLLDYPEVSAADIGFIAFYPLIITGLLSFPTRGGRVSRRPEFWIDVDTIAIGGFMLVWHFALAQMVGSNESDLLGAIVNFSYPILSLILLLGSVTVWLRDPSLEVRRALGWLTVGSLAFCGADIVYAAQSLSGTYVQGGLADAGWFVATLAFVMATSERGQPGMAALVSGARRFPYFDVRYLPYIGFAGGYGVLLYATAARGGEGTGVFIACGAVLTILVLIRQIRSVEEFASVEAEQAANAARAVTEARLHALIRNSSDVVIVADEAGRIRFTTPPMERDFGFAPEVMFGTLLLDWVHPDDRASVDEAIGHADPDPAHATPVRFRVRRSTGVWRLVEGTATDMRHESTIEGVVLNLRDITEREELEAFLRHRALHDPLTGLANRALFRDRVQHSLEREARASTGLAVLYLDLDGFKHINDSHGHAVGDEVLIYVAERLLHATRGSDTVARLGGDEFAILQEDVRSNDDVLPLVRRILDALAQPVVLGGHELAIRISIGTAFAGEGATVDEVLLRADQAMYSMKKTRREGSAPNVQTAGEVPSPPVRVSPRRPMAAEVRGCS